MVNKIKIHHSIFFPKKTIESVNQYRYDFFLLDFKSVHSSERIGPMGYIVAKHYSAVHCALCIV